MSLNGNFSLISELLIFWAKYQLITISWADRQLTVNPISTLWQAPWHSSFSTTTSFGSYRVQSWSFFSLCSHIYKWLVHCKFVIYLYFFSQRQREKNKTTLCLNGAITNTSILHILQPTPVTRCQFWTDWWTWSISFDDSFFNWL